MYRLFGKRCLDIFCALIGLVITIPVFIIIPVLIKMDSKGPVLFRQKRTGLGGSSFFLLKFRSMTTDVEKERKGFEPGSSRRITRVGRFLRQTKLDEVPQLLNVFCGDMSLVGPRPEVERYRNFYAGPFAPVLDVRPGITDTASIKYRNEEKILSASQDPEKAYRDIILPDKLQLALAYVQNGIFLKNDLQIIFQTLLTIIKRSS